MSQSAAIFMKDGSAKDKPVVLFVGAFPPAHRCIFGGMVSDCRALLQSTFPERVELQLLDTTQISNPPPRLPVRLILAMVRACRYIWRFERKRPDAVLLFASVAGSLVEKGAMAWYARLRGVPALIFPRSGSIIDDCRTSRVTRIWTRAVMAGARTVLCQGLAGRKFAIQLLGFSPERATIVSNWTAVPSLLEIGRKRQHPGTSRPVRFLFLGWLDREKGVLDLLEACEKLRGTRQFTLDLAGEGNVTDLVRKHIADRGIGDRVRLLGWLKGPQVAAALEAADVFVLPSWTEGLPNAMVEAMATRLAIIVSAVGNIPDVVIHGLDALLVPPRNPDALADALALMIDKQKVREDLADAAFATAESKFGVELAAASLERAIKDSITAGSDSAVDPATQREAIPGPSKRSFHAWRDPQTEIRIAVDRWLLRDRVLQQYIEPTRSLRIVMMYLLRIGPVALARKIFSRLAERRRNNKIAGIGLGYVLEPAVHGGAAVNQRVIFFAPNHSPHWTNVCVDARLATVATAEAWQRTFGVSAPLPDVLKAYVGWSPYSGRAIDADVVQRELVSLMGEGEVSSVASTMAPPAIRSIGIQRVESQKLQDKPTAVLFGLGNYAKTQIVPHVRPYVHVAAVHEIDPDQLATWRGDTTLDTSPLPREAERYDVWFIAGYHHTHAPLAVHALNTGAYAVVEKPLVTTQAQFAALNSALNPGENKLFTCFHKRYSSMNAWARADLGIPAGDPVDMYSIVHEIALPELHWYNWPNSGSRLVSNGCHWLDQFLYFNEFSAVRDAGVIGLRDSDVAVWVRLVNGAQLALSITDTGSSRLGVRETVELRAGKTTVRIIDAANYEAEDNARILRRRRVNPLEAHQRMYAGICRRILARQAGDSRATLLSTELMLWLEDELRGQRAR